MQILFPKLKYKYNCDTSSIVQIGKSVILKQNEMEMIDICGIIRKESIQFTDLLHFQKILEFKIVDTSNFTIPVTIWNSHVMQFKIY